MYTFHVWYVNNRNKVNQFSPFAHLSTNHNRDRVQSWTVNMPTIFMSRKAEKLNNIFTQSWCQSGKLSENETNWHHQFLTYTMYLSYVTILIDVWMNVRNWNKLRQNKKKKIILCLRLVLDVFKKDALRQLVILIEYASLFI